ncbi:MAG: acyl-CoA/acyl-ACP dehydrogenase [Chloroflexi bacterium]|nr:acyl-CoA/acyl-ACP dehydrogenase [Chloroflexota bacterium]MCY3588446.1 acyl-CoA/acyl-ACP dehydrogenase [Chloroflexota bacterium]MCY3686837.1 acyl-CoA/acyl-ACP dehydrogenase [Chloroflexota bacterium]MDE2709371.1 acyl-CoA/acyl-ACP dehydrogenase [Chloroflexota bacterium]
MDADASRQLIKQVRELARGSIRDRAADADRDGQLPIDNFNELAELGISGLLISEALGGLEADGETFVRLIEEIAYGDASTAVALNMHVLVTAIAGALPPYPHRDNVLKACAEGAWCCAPGSIPSRELDNTSTGFSATEDGTDLVISGRAGFASGADAARFAMVGALIDRPTEPDLVIALPAFTDEAITNRNNWDGMGLRSTASHDVVIEELRLPRADCFVVPLSLLRMGEQMIPQRQWQRRALPGLGICAIWLGNAQAMFDETVEYLQQRRGYLASANSPLGGSNELRSQQAWAQMALGEMDSWLASGRTMLYHAVKEVDRAYNDRQSFVRMQVRTTHHLRRMAEEVAQISIKTTGAHAYVKGQPLERLYRDLTGGIVMAWKTDELQHSLGLAALGEEITIVGPAGT